MEDVKRGPGRPPKAANVEPTEVDLGEATNARLRGLELQLRSISGRRETPQQVFEKASEIVGRFRAARLSGGKNFWRVYNSRYKDAAGEPVVYEFYSDAKDPESARADYNRRNDRYWSPDEGDDPLKFELVKPDSE